LRYRKSLRETGGVAKKSAAAGDVLDSQVVELMAASRVLVAACARSMAGLDAVVTPVQMRALVIVASRGGMRLTELAQALDVHPSNATRTCDKLVAAGLMARQENPQNRRELVLTLTSAGQRLVTAIGRRRGDAISEVLRAVPVERRDQVVAAMREFAAAGGEAQDDDLWAMGWTT